MFLCYCENPSNLRHLCAKWDNPYKFRVSPDKYQANQLFWSVADAFFEFDQRLRIAEVW